MTNMLVTGGAGFIGTNFVRHWLRTHAEDRITVLDLLTYAGRRSNLNGVDCAFAHGDINDQRLVATLLREHAIDTIVNFAAETHVDRSIADSEAFLRANVLGTHSLLEAARSVWAERRNPSACRFHQVSTDEVFGSLGPSDPAFNEKTPFSPNSPYSASKAAADHLVRAYGRTFGLPVTISHCSNNYGPYQYPEKLIPLFLMNALQGLPLPVYGDGLNVRDWLFVEDHCRGIELILRHGAAGETYAIGGGSELANLTVVDALCTALDHAFEEDPDLARLFPRAPAALGRASASLRRFVTDRAGHDRRYAIDDAKIRTELGYRPLHDFRQSFVATVHWYLDHRDWWQSTHFPKRAVAA
jgi:dTDP-glucose 4,6-dehydratase